MTPSAIAAAQVVAAGAGVVGTAVGVSQSHKATQETEKAQEAQQRIADVEAQRKRDLALRQSRIQRARIENVAAQTGTEGSAGAMGAVQSISSQTNANLSFLDTTRQLATQASTYRQRAADASSRAQIGGALSKIGQTYGDFGAIDRI
jgi:hypothetical protein